MFYQLLTVLLVGIPKDVTSSPIPEAKKDFKQDWFTMALNYMKSNPETLEELLMDNYALVEGDMILSTDRNAVKSKWPTREIPYVISPDLEGKTNEILAAMAMVSKHTCVSFHNQTSEANYLLFQSSKGCASYVGVIGGAQPVFVGPLCAMGNIVHEILHALGFHHEHTRKDRDQYVTVLSNNIMKGMERNFKVQEGETFDLSYDVTSIMHYGSGFFSANGLPTIVPYGDIKNMGQRLEMTKTDIEKVRNLYNCDAKDKAPEEESDSAKKEEEEDAFVNMFVHDVDPALRTTSKGHVSAHQPEEGHTLTAAPPSVSLHYLNNATRGQNDTSGEMD